MSDAIIKYVANRMLECEAWSGFWSHADACILARAAIGAICHEKILKAAVDRAADAQGRVCRVEVDKALAAEIVETVLYAALNLEPR